MVEKIQKVLRELYKSRSDTFLNSIGCIGYTLKKERLHVSDMHPINQKNGCTHKPLVLLVFIKCFYIMQPIQPIFYKKYI